MRTVIAGSRDITNPEVIVPIIESAPWRPSVVICGLCRGVDMAGRAWALQHGIPVEEYPADWTTYGNAAGPIRNAEMARVSDALILIHYVDSRGSRSMLGQGKLHHLHIFDIVVPQPPELP